MEAKIRICKLLYCGDPEIGLRMNMSPLFVGFNLKRALHHKL